MGFQMQICSILRFSWLILVKCCVHLRMSSSKTQMILLERTMLEIKQPRIKNKSELPAGE